MVFFRTVILGLLLLLVVNGKSYSQCVASGSTTVVNICSGNLPFVWNNKQYNEPGCYLIRLTNAAGCDSIANLNLQVNSVSSSGNINTCSQDFPYLWHGKTLPAPGIYMDSILNYQGCDSIMALNLTASDEWTGGTDNNWENINNWACHALPGMATDVVINGGTVILNSDQTVRSLTVAPGASFTITPGIDLHITSAALTAAPVYLTKYIGYVDNGNGSYRFIENNYHYDSLNRLQTIIKNIFQFPPGIGDPGDFDSAFPDTLTYSYYPGDTLPYKVVYHNGGLYDQAEYYTYDTQLRLSRIVYPGSQNYSIKYRYSDSSNEIIITDTFSLLHLLVYDGNNVTHDDLGSGGAGGVTTEYTSLTDPFSLVPVNRHIPYSEGWINPGETHFNKNAASQTTAPGYQLIYEYSSIINGIPARAKLTQTINGQTTNILQYFYYKY